MRWWVRWAGGVRVAAWASASASASAQPTAMSHTADGWHFRLARLGEHSQITEKLRRGVAKLALLDYSRIKSSLSRTGRCQGEGCTVQAVGGRAGCWLPGCLAAWRWLVPLPLPAAARSLARRIVLARDCLIAVGCTDLLQVNKT